MVVYLDWGGGIRFARSISQSAGVRRRANPFESHLATV